MEEISEVELTAVDLEKAEAIKIWRINKLPFIGGFLSIFALIGPFVPPIGGGEASISRHPYLHSVFIIGMLLFLLFVYYVYEMIIVLGRDIRSNKKIVLLTRISRIDLRYKNVFNTVNRKYRRFYSPNVDIKVNKGDLIEIHFLKKSGVVLQICRKNDDGKQFQDT